MTTTINSVAELPKGFLRSSEVAKLLRMNVNDLIAQSETGKLPKPEYIWAKYENSGLHKVRAYKEKDIMPLVPGKKKKTPKRLPPSALGFLERLRRYADKNGFVSGDATDIITGNPARTADWDAINILAKANALEWSLDGWDRLTFQLHETPKDPDASKERKAF